MTFHIARTIIMESRTFQLPRIRELLRQRSRRAPDPLQKKHMKQNQDRLQLLQLLEIKKSTLTERACIAEMGHALALPTWIASHAFLSLIPDSSFPWSSNAPQNSQSGSQSPKILPSTNIRMWNMRRAPKLLMSGPGMRRCPLQAPRRILSG